MSERKLFERIAPSSERKSCCSGSRFSDKMHLVYDERGRKHLEKVGETDNYALIQSYRDSCDLSKILQKCLDTGDASLLQRAQGVFSDLTGMPTDLRQAQQILTKARVEYEGLNLKVKALYPTFESFLEAFSTKENLQQYYSAVTPETPSEGGSVNES